MRIFLAGDSTMSDYGPERAPRAGWGQRLGQFLPEDVEVRNHAASGRSTKSFIAEGRLAALEDELDGGDLLLVQFGHNDQKDDEERHTDAEPDGSFRHNLAVFVDVARRRGASPVLITPVQRRSFDEQGRFRDTHGAYADAVRETAERLAVPLLDLGAESRSRLEAVGPERAKAWYLWLSPGERPGYPDGARDDTHFSEEGAGMLAEWVAGRLAEGGWLDRSVASTRRKK
ncbi:rhamnogalacturonan acetylesterase [Paenibacillus sp. TRM 82003]|nr:rhamnogalacturonan acetylesterase [Paenibacillus sp. TRM 82003]